MTFWRIMNSLRTLWLRFKMLLQKQPVDRETDAEMRLHVEMQTQQNIADGMNAKDARRAAFREFGSIESLKETCREQRGLRGAETLVGDICFALRMLRKNPGFTIVAVLTLALGIGANTAIFSIINGVLLRPLPYRDPDRLVTVCERNLRRGYPQITVTPANLQAWREQNSVFSELGGEIYESFNLTGFEKPLHVNAARTTPNFFSVFGITPLLGRTFVADDQTNGVERVAVLNYGLWRRCFAGDRQIIGRIITLSGVNYIVVGVMPESFKIFSSPMFGLPTGEVDPEIWVPYEGPMNVATYHFFACFARLKPGVTLSQAQSEMDAIAEGLNQGSPRGPGWGATVQFLQDHIVGSSRPACLLLMAAVGFLLLIACANVANLSLARSLARGREFAIRSALGAARSRLVRQLLVESVILAIIGGCAGVLLARWSLAGLVVFLPAKIPRLNEVRLDGSVLCFSLVVSVLTGLLFGLAPAFTTSTHDLTRRLKDAAIGCSEGRRTNGARGFLVVTQVALAMVLLAGAALMIDSFARLIRVNPGFEPERLISFDVSTTEAAYSLDAKRKRLVKELRARVATLPGVQSAAIVYGLPFGIMLNATCGAAIEGKLSSDSPEKGSVAWRVVSPDYFQTMRVPVKAGRAFSDQLDTPGSSPVVIINEAFAKKYYRDQNPMGRRIQVFTVSTNWNEIVGIVKDMKLTALDKSTGPEIYQPDTQQAPWMFSLVVRSALPLGEVEKMVRAQAAGIDKDLPLFNVRTMGDAINTSVSPHRLTMILVGFFAALALVLTAVGIYGVVSYSVGRRTWEIGIRIALGASRRSVLALILQQGLGLAIFGIAVGMASGLALTRLIASQLFGVSPTDPVIFGAVDTFLMLVMLAACYLPARRATKIDPMVSLRYE
jgi:putative ABC transport system permease protein